MSATSNLDVGDVPPCWRGRTVRPRDAQRGVLLLELLVGITVGMLVVTSASGLLLLSRGTATTVTELSHLQQQGAHALRVIGRYVRQAGTRDLRANAAGGHFSLAVPDMDEHGQDVVGREGPNGGPDELSVSHALASGLPVGSQPDCIGNIPTTAVVASSFRVTGDDLRCDNGMRSYPMTGDVADFQVRYRVTTPAGTQSMTAADVDAAALWTAVSAVEVCLDLQGSAQAQPLGDSTYRSCQQDGGGRFVDVPTAGRLHVVFRQLYDLRTREGAL